MSATHITAEFALEADPLLRHHDSSVRGAVAEMQAIAADLPTGINALDLRLAALPSAVDLLVANPLSADGVAALHRLTAEMITFVTRIHTQVTTLRQLGTHGRTQLEKFEARLAQIRRHDADGLPCDESTVNGDLAEAS